VAESDDVGACNGKLPELCRELQTLNTAITCAIMNGELQGLTINDALRLHVALEDPLTHHYPA
jgi:hypothetical protein